MNYVDLLSDTIYCEQAVKQLNKILGNASIFPVAYSQIYGLRQIARQQPHKVLPFAQHQNERAEKLNKAAEVDFWSLVAELCKPYNPSDANWSVCREGTNYLPEGIREQDIPPKRKGMQQKEQSERNQLRKKQKEWLKQWEKEHIPAFFERFCTECLYRKTMIETAELKTEHNG